MGLMKQRYRIFTNDRGRVNGIPMYSALKDVTAASPEEARRKVPAAFDAPNFAPAVAIRWPESSQAEHEKEWLRRHV
jgi:hypothetical protein